MYKIGDKISLKDGREVIIVEINSGYLDKIVVETKDFSFSGTGNRFYITKEEIKI